MGIHPGNRSTNQPVHKNMSVGVQLLILKYCITQNKYLFAYNDGKHKLMARCAYVEWLICGVVDVST